MATEKKKIVLIAILTFFNIVCISQECILDSLTRVKNKKLYYLDTTIKINYGDVRKLIKPSDSSLVQQILSNGVNSLEFESYLQREGTVLTKISFENYRLVEPDSLILSVKERKVLKRKEYLEKKQSEAAANSNDADFSKFSKKLMKKRFMDLDDKIRLNQKVLLVIYFYRFNNYGLFFLNEYKNFDVSPFRYIICRVP